MDEKNVNSNDIDSSDIFNDFIDDKSLLDEVKELKEKERKDLYFYLLKGAKFLQVIFWLGLLIIGILYTYIFIQNKIEYNNKIINPFCNIFLGDMAQRINGCTTISSLEKAYNDELLELKNKTTQDVLGLVEDIYKVESFTKSKEVLFLLDKSKNKLPVLFILEEFDNLKNDFYKFDKQKIQCNSLVLDSNKKTLSMSCEAFSAGYEKGIRGFDGTTENSVKGTSISIANSFLNYIDINSDLFEIVDKQKTFKSEDIIGEKSDFTNKTTFDLKLTYNIQ